VEVSDLSENRNTVAGQFRILTVIPSHKILLYKLYPKADMII